MDLKQNVIICALVIIQLINYGNSVRTKDKMYEIIKGSKACFRRMNATHQIGCSSKRGGSTGAIHYCENQSDLDFILKNGTAGPYIPIIPTHLFTSPNMKRLRSSNKISGLLLYVEEQKPDYFTHENQCPNPKSGVDGTCGSEFVWNPKGTGLLYQDIPFPVFYVENEDYVKAARDCFERHNNYSYATQRDRSLCSLELVSFMYATRDTPTCIRRSNSVTNLNPVKFCDPLGDQNVWAPLFPLARGANLTEPVKDFKYIIVAARLDTTSMFDKTAGAISPVTGLVTLLATAKLLKSMLPENHDYDKNVLFVLFNGETYDYIGSQRFLYEMLSGNFPVKSGDGSILPEILPKDIALWVELTQISHSDSLVAHNFLGDPDSERFYLELNSNKDGLNLHESKQTLPPASLHTFLNNRPKLPGIVLADHERAYANHFYNSIYDNASNIHYQYFNATEDSAEDIPSSSVQKFVANVSAMVARSVYHEIVGSKYQGVEAQADLQLIDELFHCYLENSNCRVHQAIQKMKLQAQPMNLYVGVEVVSNLLTSLVGLTLGWVTGDIVGEGNSNCTNEPRNYAFRFYNMSKSLDDLNTTLCYRTTMNFTEAISPAFIIKNYDWSSGQYSTWTESTWGDIRMRIFLKPSAAHENMTIAIGSMVLIFSFICVYFVKSRSDVLFAPPLPTLAPTNC